MIVIAKKINKSSNKTEIYKSNFIKELLIAIKLKLKGYTIQFLKDKEVKNERF